ncbi:MAG: response regulator transcription factor [Pleurocapsa sp.]
MKSISIYQKTHEGKETISLKFTIMGEVWFNNSLFLIIQPDFALLNGDRNSITIVQENAYYSVFGQINLNDHDCLVVQPKDSLTNAVLDPQDLLSERELQIVDLVAHGKSNKQIARKLKISEWTVSTHLRRIFIKLEVDSRAAMVYRCASLVRYRLQKVASNQ